jgi:hypothetical protein
MTDTQDTALAAFAEFRIADAVRLSLDAAAEFAKGIPVLAVNLPPSPRQSRRTKSTPDALLTRIDLALDTNPCEYMPTLAPRVGQRICVDGGRGKRLVTVMDIDGSTITTTL